MAAINFAELEALMGANKWDEVEKILNDYIDADNSDDERGEAYVALAEVYARAKLHYSKQYLAKLQDSMQALNALNAAAGNIDKDIGIAKVHDKINKIK